MKPRLMIDGALAWSAVPLTIAFFMSPTLYWIASRPADHWLDVLGVICIFKGSLIRMAARGHKRKFPRWDLVMTGPYTMTRNPMYLGTFMIATGFLLIVWPWWTLPIFAVLFYQRFIREVKKEEAQLLDAHKANYAEYCRNTPRVWPSFRRAWSMKMRDIINISELFSTNEANLLFLPVAAWLLGSAQQYCLFGSVHLLETLGLFLATLMAFVMIFLLRYKFL